MGTVFRLWIAESVKLRRSAALRLVWLLPLAFVVLEFVVVERRALDLRILPEGFQATFETTHLKMLGAIWAGFFHPLLVAMLPALLFRPEHRFKLWKHLHSMPVPRRAIYLVKVAWMLVLSFGSLVLVGLGLWLVRVLMAWFNPLLDLPFHGLEVVRVLGWLWVGSLPILAFYLWIADRINSLAVPVVFGLIGLILTISLSGADLPKPWKRDLIPWVLPYFSTQAALKNAKPLQTVHVAGRMFQQEPNVLRLPNGKRVKTWQNIPDDELFPAAPPTPGWVLGTFSACAGVILLGLGIIEAGRNRA